MSVFSAADNLIYELCANRFGDGYVTCLLAGDYGLLTMTPAYLMFFLFPVMFVFTVFQQVLNEIIVRRNSDRRCTQLSIFSPSCAIPLLSGFGCTTAALAILSSYSKPHRLACSILLCLAIPCSAQTAVIVAVSSLVGFPYILIYLCFVSAVFFALAMVLNILFFQPDCNIATIYRGSQSPWEYKNIKKQRFLRHREDKDLGSTKVIATRRKLTIEFKNQYVLFKTSLWTALKYTKTTALPFAVGSLLVSTLMYFNFFAAVCAFASPVVEGGLLLPREAASIFVLSMVKRDLGAAGLLSVMSCGGFTAAEMVVTLIILTLFVPCFSSFVILIKQEGVASAVSIWLFCMFVALLVGKAASMMLL